MGDGESGKHRTYSGLIVDNAGQCVKQDRGMTSWDRKSEGTANQREKEKGVVP